MHTLNRNLFLKPDILKLCAIFKPEKYIIRKWKKNNYSRKALKLIADTICFYQTLTATRPKMNWGPLSLPRTLRVPGKGKNESTRPCTRTFQPCCESSRWQLLAESTPLRDDIHASDSFRFTVENHGASANVPAFAKGVLAGDKFACLSCLWALIHLTCIVS